MIRVSVTGVSVLGPGLGGWVESAPVLRGTREWIDAATSVPPASLLPPNERRRSSLPVRLGMAVSQEAVTMAGFPLALPRGVFASSNGEGEVLHAILHSMTAPGGQVSPTRFHNSVHNAVAANWTIGVGSMRPATSIGMHDDTFAAGLLKAAAEAVYEGEPVLFCAYDAPIPWPMHPHRPTEFGFAAAFVLVPEAGARSGPTGRGSGADCAVSAARSGTPMARLALRYAVGTCEPDFWLPRRRGPRGLARGNPAARGLRLLEAVATGQPDRFALPLGPGKVEIEVTR